MRKTLPSSVFRFTSVLTAVNGTISYFRSLDEVPPELQRHIDKALHGHMTASIILADEGGQKYLQSRTEITPPVEPSPDQRRLLVRRFILEAASAFAVALALWILAAAR